MPQGTDQVFAPRIQVGYISHRRPSLALTISYLDIVAQTPPNHIQISKLQQKERKDAIEMEPDDRATGNVSHLLRSIIATNDSFKVPKFDTVAEHFRNAVGLTEEEATTVAIRLKYYNCLKATPTKESFEKGALVKGPVTPRKRSAASGGNADGSPRKRGRPAKGKAAGEGGKEEMGGIDGGAVKEEDVDLERPY
ncbi:hypothetical protein BJ508DRAFT_330891 [Ascobolus immersus RN42]|uniref:Uncharacterized protein n=1 Tax=Ascobolus immersus RN42 TaxID=1160509 RepID=A0A3N4HXQ6_ASCIM|nr:hypothetical protein BJ508DRAFT_330891 [Ascobolus immersus RN42]